MGLGEGGSFTWQEARLHRSTSSETAARRIIDQGRTGELEMKRAESRRPASKGSAKAVTECSRTTPEAAALQILLAAMGLRMAAAP